MKTDEVILDDCWEWDIKQDLTSLRFFFLMLIYLWEVSHGF